LEGSMQLDILRALIGREYAKVAILHKDVTVSQKTYETETKLL